MLRYAKKNEVSSHQKFQLIDEWEKMDKENNETFPNEEPITWKYSIVWVPKPRRTNGRRVRGFGGFYSFKMNQTSEGEIKICDECGELFVNICGNYVDDLEYCDCGAKCYDD